MSRYYHIFSTVLMGDKRTPHQLVVIDTKRIAIAEGIMGLECSTSAELAKFYRGSADKDVRYHRLKRNIVDQLKETNMRLYAFTSARRLNQGALTKITNKWTPEDFEKFTYRY